jgi:hypothetical protein
MKNAKTALPKDSVKKGILGVEIIGFFLAALTLWVTEYFDPPFSYMQVIVESTIIIALGSITVYLTGRLIQRIKYLEGFLVICSSCKKVRIDDRWVSIEYVIAKNSEVQLSHGSCPQCTEKLYGEFFEKGKD